MKIFQSIKISIDILGIYRPQLLQPFHRFNLKNSFLLAFFFLFSIAISIHIIYEAETFDERSEASMGGCVAFAVLGLFILALWKTHKFFQLIDNFENTIQKREWLLF